MLRWLNGWLQPGMRMFVDKVCRPCGSQRSLSSGVCTQHDVCACGGAHRAIVNGWEPSISAAHQVGRMRTPWLTDRVSAGVDSVTVAPGVRRLPVSSTGLIQPIWSSFGVLYPAHRRDIKMDGALRPSHKTMCRVHLTIEQPTPLQDLVHPDRQLSPQPDIVRSSTAFQLWDKTARWEGCDGVEHL